MNESERLSARQLKAIRALLSAPSIVAAAEGTGIGESTIRRWISEDSTFRDALRRRERELWQETVRALQASGLEAVEQLAAIARDGAAPAGARVSACKTILDHLRQLQADDLLERLEAVERLLSEETKS